jgi:hypothetical protein
MPSVPEDPFQIPGFDALCRHREELIISMYKRSGAFWESISELRRKWGISPQRKVPHLDSLEHELQFHPRLDPWALDEWVDNVDLSVPVSGTKVGVPDTPTPGYPLCGPQPDDDGNRELTSEWYSDRSNLLRESVPRELRQYRAYQDDYWLTFIGGCLLYDPPADALWDFFVSMPLMNPYRIVRPIVSLNDTWDVEHATSAYYEALLKEIGEQLKPHGFNIGDLRMEALIRNSDIGNAKQRYLERSETTDYIVVRSDTKREEVLDAYNQIASTLPEATSLRKRGRPRVSRLKAVQVAVLHDEFRISQRKLAEAADLPLSKGAEIRDDKYVQRSGTVQYYVKIGREILAQK